MSNSANILLALDSLKTIFSGRLKIFLGKENAIDIDPPRFVMDNSPFASFIQRHQPSFDEYVILLLAMAPHIKPEYLSSIITEYIPDGSNFPEIGGTTGSTHRGILPTGETAQFIIAGNNLDKRIEVQRILGNDHWLARKHILWLEPIREGEPKMSGRLTLNPEIVEELTLGKISRPLFSIDFPAEYLETEMNPDDLVLPPETMLNIREIENWIAHNDTLLYDWNMKKVIKPGYRAIFHGPPGNGKTLTATLLGKKTGKDVFRIDLSRVISKYIGETEKNLSRLFDKAENKNWILFFDEADALFGKRTDVRDAHDKYANQEVAYLLQRIESYNGLVILATNRKTDIDEAFSRRFQSIVHFPILKPGERYSLWIKLLPSQLAMADDIDWHMIAQRYDLSGASILNIIHYCSIEALASSQPLNLKKLEKAIIREFTKGGKVV
ncbi:ATP-binding protein [Chlorobium limicola]|uniref:AAA family ATPase n=1 Tax=Chlorobium limicola TaxID=1092 RepID=A0A101JIV4_CHLLI|nr:ATP-binding protein [Chlorobium limicola]KUL27661.1 AAA family ATPase [Chlorobium limicola]